MHGGLAILNIIMFKLNYDQLIYYIKFIQVLISYNYLAFYRNKDYLLNQWISLLFINKDIILIRSIT